LLILYIVAGNRTLATEAALKELKPVERDKSGMPGSAVKQESNIMQQLKVVEHQAKVLF